MTKCPLIEEAALAAYHSHFGYHTLASAYLYLACSGVSWGNIGLSQASLAVLLGAICLFLFDLIPRFFLPHLSYPNYPKLIVWPLYAAIAIAVFGLWLPMPGFLVVAAVLTTTLMSPSHRVGISILEANFPQKFEQKIAFHSFWGLAGFAIGAPGLMIVIEIAAANRIAASVVLIIGFATLLGIIRASSQQRPDRGIDWDKENNSCHPKLPKPIPRDSRQFSSYVVAGVLAHVFCGEFLFWLSHGIILFAAVQLVGAHGLVAVGITVFTISSVVLLSFFVSLKFPAFLMQEWLQAMSTGGIALFAFLFSMFGASCYALLITSSMFLLVRVPLLDRQNAVIDEFGETPFLSILRVATMAGTSIGAVAAIYVFQFDNLSLIVFSAAGMVMLVSQFLIHRISLPDSPATSS